MLWTFHASSQQAFTGFTQFVHTALEQTYRYMALEETHCYIAVEQKYHSPHFVGVPHGGGHTKDGIEPHSNSSMWIRLLEQES